MSQTWAHCRNTPGPPPEPYLAPNCSYACRPGDGGAAAPHFTSVAWARSVDIVGWHWPDPFSVDIGQKMATFFCGPNFGCWKISTKSNIIFFFFTICYRFYFVPFPLLSFFLPPPSPSPTNLFPTSITLLLSQFTGPVFCFLIAPPIVRPTPVRPSTFSPNVVS